MPQGLLTATEVYNFSESLVYLQLSSLQVDLKLQGRL